MKLSKSILLTAFAANMRTIVLTTMLAASSLAAQAAVYTLSGPTVNSANGHSYYLLAPGTWTESEAYAQTLGGHLVTVNNAAENTWFFANVALGGSAIPWTGLNDIDGNGIWTWASGEPVTYLNWAPGEPNSPGHGHFYGNVFAHDTANAGMWNNSPNSDLCYGIVEVVPEPSAMALLFLGGVGYVARKRREV